MITKENLVKYLEREFLETYRQELSQVQKRIDLFNYEEDGDFHRDYNLREKLMTSIELTLEIINDINEGKLDNYTAEFKG